MATVLALYVLVFVTVIVQIFGNDLPYVDPTTFPVPGKALKPIAPGDPAVKSYEFHYSPRVYSFKTRWFDGRYHSANGTLKRNDDKMEFYYVEEGHFTEILANKTANLVDYIVDENGFQELDRKQVNLITTRLSSRAIGSLLG